MRGFPCRLKPAAPAARVRWLGLELPAILNPKDPVIAHGLASPVKYVRIVRRKLNRRNRFYAQLICAGQPYRKARHGLGQGVVGLDIGPSNIAIVSDQLATLEPFCAELAPQQQVIRRLQRKLDRQRRSGNPNNYQPNGTVKPGPKKWTHSRRYVYTRDQLAELHRRQAAHRQGLHNRMVNQVLALGDVIKLEKLSYRAFQKRYGRSVGFRGPGTFVARLRRKAESAGAQVDEFSTRLTRLSQTCLCGAVTKKPLSLRWHLCDCGVGPIQRDLFSAWLACFVENNRLDAGQAQAAWPGVDTRLRTASSTLEPATGQGNPPHLNQPVVGSGQSRSSVQSGAISSDTCHGAIPAVTRKLAFQPEPAGFSRAE